MFKSKIAGFFILISLWSIVACNNRNDERKVNLQARELNDSASRIYFKVIGLLYPKDSLKRSIALFEKAIQKDSDYRLAYHNLWSCLNYTGQYAESEELCSKWIRRHPGDGDFLIKRGILRDVLGKEKLAKSDYDAVYNLISKDPLPLISPQLDPESIQKVTSRAYNLIIITGHKSEAMKIMESLKESFPNKPQINAAYENIVHLDRSQYLLDLL
ncbi:tetratricopeptide repeat protein [Pedobacter endophyticus]|uniref:Tetratricopeptide repeat protein n=1 Tax=Pedobacter endophyticus TaxID=2789740 RepID=A0A7S9KY35_9SPHI|nr:hypothetical protein [Pedobacter endophyticus]QPH38940.1 hypothetical protein IZT61_18030 [Pedobacter endophyticus]